MNWPYIAGVVTLALIILVVFWIVVGIWMTLKYRREQREATPTPLSCEVCRSPDVRTEARLGNIWAYCLNGHTYVVRKAP